MKKKQNLTILLSAVIMISLVCGTAFAKRPTPPTPPPPTPVCGGLTGTWHGQEPGDMMWLAIHTSDSLDPTKGEMLMNWIWIAPALIGDGNSLTSGHGVWQLKSEGMYNFTWYAYVIDLNGTLSSTVRVSGVASFNPDDPDDCDTVSISYQFATSSPVDVGGLKDADFIDSNITGFAYQTRVPMDPALLPLQ